MRAPPLCRSFFLGGGWFSPPRIVPNALVTAAGEGNHRRRKVDDDDEMDGLTHALDSGTYILLTIPLFTGRIVATRSRQRAASARVLVPLRKSSWSSTTAAAAAFHWTTAAAAAHGQIAKPRMQHYTRT